jgi:RNA polymerase sigma-70 factor (ECF subfamily)
LSDEMPVTAEFREVVQGLEPSVLSLLARLLHDAEEARDACQETWLAVWRRWPRVRALADPWPYVRRTAIRKAIDRMRARRAPVPLAGDVAAAGAPREARVDLGFLPPEERLCLTLFFWEGCSVRQIAGELRVPEGTVRSWMFRGRARIRERLAKEER